MYTSNFKWTKRDKKEIKPNLPGPKPLHEQIVLNDIGFRLVLIPFFGIVIPLITDMVSSLDSNSWLYKMGFLYTIGIAWIVWEGNRFLLFTLRDYFDWFNRPLRKIGALLLVVPFYTVPVSVLLLVMWYKIFTTVTLEWPKIWLATSIILIFVIFIVHVYETVFLVKQAESQMLRNVRLEKAKTEAELQSLKSQIDPHFIFNSLNTLSYFIEEDANKAQIFNQKLSEVYRYILQNRTSDFVLLSEEIAFVKNYFSLFQLRFDNALILNIDTDHSLINTIAVLPISVQLLVENAIKHNEFSDVNPLCIDLLVSEDYILVKNEMRVKSTVHKSGVGLRNLDERYRLLTGRGIIINKENGIFEIKIPANLI